MQSEHALMRGDVDQNMQTPAQQFEDWTLHQQRDHSKYDPERDQAVTGVVELPDILKMLRALGVGEQVRSHSGCVPPDADDRWHAKAKDVGEDAPEDQPAKVEWSMKSAADWDSGCSRPECVSKNVHGFADSYAEAQVQK